MPQIDRNSDIPLYVQIKQKLDKRIKKLSPHMKIPSEPELAKKYQISRSTAKRAIDRLISERKVYRIQGRGTFVAPPEIVRSFSELPNYSDDIRKLGLKPDVLHLSVTKQEPTVKIKNALRLSSTSKVWCVSRVRTADEEPVVHVISYVPVYLIPKLKKEDVVYSLYEAMASAIGLRPSWANDTYRVETAIGERAKLLKIPNGTPILASERIAYLEDNRPVEYVESYIRGDRFAINVIIKSATYLKNTKL